MGSAMRKAVAAIPRGWLPFADIGTAEVPFSRFLRLSLFQLSIGAVQTLFIGTLNRVMIVELQVPAALVALMVAIPLLVAPFRALMGFRSDTHRSILGWRRVPYLWMGTLCQWMGLAIMPFALLVMSDPLVADSRPYGIAASVVAFFLVGFGAHMTQTAGLALASDLATEDKRPRVVALMYVMLMVGVVLSAFAVGQALREYTPIRLIQVIHTVAAATIWFNTLALWQQEPRRAGITPYAKGERRPMFRDAWRTFTAGGRVVRLLVGVGLGFFAFNLQDVLLEPYGGQVLGLSVGATTGLTGLMALGAVAAFAVAAWLLERGHHPLRVAMVGCGVGILAFATITVASQTGLVPVFRTGVFAIGFGEALFGVGTLSFAMGLRDEAQHGMALGAWGAVFATGEGVALGLSGFVKDLVAQLVQRGGLVLPVRLDALPYDVVYLLEIVALVATLVALLPLAAGGREDAPGAPRRFGLADLPT